MLHATTAGFSLAEIMLRLAQGIGIEDKMWNDSIQIQITNAIPVNEFKIYQFHSNYYR